MKRALSVLLTLAMLLSMVSVLFATNVAAATVITNTSPAIAATVGQKITLSNYSVTFDGDSSATSGVTWKNGSTTITSFTPSAKGVTKLTAISGSKSKSIYVVAKHASDVEYVLYEATMADFATTSALTNAGWTIPASSYMDSGDLIVSSASAFLPAWLGEFGDYAFSGDFRIKSAADSTRWFSLVYRADQLSNVNDYLHMCVRSNTEAENGVEFAEKNANGWNVLLKGVGLHSQMGEKYRNVRVAAYGKTISNELCGDQVIYVDSSVYAGVTSVANKGYLGITMDQGEVRVKNVKVTLQTSAPVKQTGMIYNDYHDADNLVNPIANVQKIESTSASLANLSVAYYDLTTGINALTAMQNSVAAKVVPTFFVSTEAQAFEVINAARVTGNEDMTVISDSASVIDYLRMKNNKIRLGLEIDLVDEMKDGVLSDKEADVIRITARSAPASFVVIGTKYADKMAVAELQEMALAVWVRTDSVAGSDQFARDAMRALTSGANGIISGSASAVSSYINTYFAENTFTRTPITIGHRGNPNVAPENTIESFEAAYNNGGDVFEIDVQLTSDSIVVVNHDTTLNRTTNYTGTAKIADMTWAEVQQYHVLALDGVTSTGKPIPSLEETLNWAKGKDIKIFVEFKNSTSNCIKLTMNKIAELGMTQQVDVISFNRPALAYTQIYSPGMSTGYLLGGSSVTCPDYAAAVDYFYSRIEKAHDIKSTINPESYSNQINNLAVQAATDRGMTLWPYTFNATTTNTAFFDCPDGITTNNMELIKDMPKLMHSESFALDVGETYSGEDVKYETYGNEIAVAENAIPYVITGDCVEVQDGKLVAVKDGIASVMFGYATETYSGSPYVLYTQPVTVRVGGTLDANGEKVVYIPIDNRPINLERVEYMVAASGFELVLPDESIYSTLVDTYNEGVSDQGNPEELFEWLKTVDDAKYYIISLDQIFSGGLVGSRAPFGDTDDTIASDITNYDWTVGGYELSEKEQEIIDYLIALSNRADTHVIFFDTVMRLASTGNYMDYRGNDYSNFRAYGMLDRIQFEGDNLTIENIVKNYNKDANGNDIAYAYTDEASQGTSNYTDGYPSGSSMIFYDSNNILRALSNDEFKEYYASRERKLKIADALYPNVVDSAARLYIGFDDSNPKITIQSNEGRYITEKLIGDAENCHLFSGADELGMMGLADIATSIYGKVDISPVYFGGGENLPADEYDTGTLKTNVDVHINGIGGTINNDGSGELQVLILTRTDGGDGYSTAETQALNTAVAELVKIAERNLNEGVPTAIVDCSDKDGVLSNAILASDLKNRLGELLGYSQWNTIANSLGTSISNAVARFTYLKNSIVITDESHEGFMQTIVAAWVKDVAYQQVGGRPQGSEYNFPTYYNKAIDSAETLVNYINGSDIVTSVVNGVSESYDGWNATVSSFRWPWDRAFEAEFDINVGTNLQYRDEVDYESYKISNVTAGKDYEFSYAPTSEAYADSGKELTDGIMVSDSDINDPGYADTRWVGFTLNKTIRETSITIPLGGLYDLYQFAVNIGGDKLGAGITCPNVEVLVSTDGVNFNHVRSVVSTTDTTNYAINLYIGAPFEKVEATHVRIKLTPRTGNLLWISEIQAYGTKSANAPADSTALKVHTYTTDETYKWWPDWNNPPCAEGATYDDGKRLIDGQKNYLNFCEGVSGWYPTSSITMDFNLLKTSMVDEIVATFDKYSTYAIPDACKVEVSVDGVTYTEVKGSFSSVVTVPQAEGSVWSAYECKVKLDTPVQAKHVRLTYTSTSKSLFLCEEVEFYGTDINNIVANKPYETSGPADGKYTAENFGLTDGFVNTYTVYNNTTWLWSARNTVDNKGSVIFHLDGTYNVSGAATHVNMVEKSGIVPPKGIAIYTSMDGVNYTKLSDMTAPVYNNDNIEVLWWDAFTEATLANFVKIEYTIDTGFIMFDEIEVYGAKATDGDHVVSDEWSSDETGHWNECTCGDVYNKSEHDLKWVVTKEAGYHEEGEQAFKCTVCGYVADTSIIEAEHVYDSEWQSDEFGHWQNCECGESSDTITAHDDGVWVTTKEAEVGVDGLKELKCTVCGYVLDSEVIPALEEEIFVGDVNENGIIDSIDYIMLKRTYFGAFALEDIRSGDINGNGEIDSTDYVLLRRMYFNNYSVN